MDSLSSTALFQKKPQPNFDELLETLQGKRLPTKVHFIEMLIDEEIKRFIIENIFHERNYPPVVTFGGSTDRKSQADEDTREAVQKYYQQLILFYYRMGYSVIADYEFLVNFQAFSKVGRVGKDNEALHLRRDSRHWAEEGKGMIQSMEDFERFPWPEVEHLAELYPEHIHSLSKLLPDGMKIAVVGSVLEQVMEWLLGYEGVFYGLYDNPDLIEAVFYKVGEIVNRLYKNVVGMPGVGVIWHGDDIGFNLGTILPVGHLQRLVFPWFKRYAETAHSYGKPVWYHGCGNKKSVMEDFIEDIRFDAIHSFEDSSYPVTEYKQKYGRRITLLGGVDVDKMVRLSEVELRRYVHQVLDICMPGGCFALGSGNSVCNYIPVHNYLIMLDEGMRYL